MEATIDGIQPRRIPKQARSRRRYETVLNVARDLIAQRGNDGVSMREIADAADMPIASVYQYFPDKNALLWTLIAEPFERLEQRWSQALDVAQTVEAVNEASIRLFDGFVEHCRQEPSFARLWGSAQANVVLTEIDQALNQRIASGYAKKIKQLMPEVNVSAVERITLLMATLSSAALQLAFNRPQQRQALLDDFRHLMSVQFKLLRSL